MSGELLRYLSEQLCFVIRDVGYPEIPGNLPRACRWADKRSVEFLFASSREKC